MALIDVRSRPSLRRPLLLSAFGGWGDAGSGATGAINYLLGDPTPEAFAAFDSEVCFDFTVQRPVTHRTEDGRWTISYPEIRFYAVERPEWDYDLIILTGPEPHMNWPTLTRAAAQLAVEFGVEQALTLGVFLGSVSHRTKALVRRTLDLGLDEKLAALGAVDTGYQGPTGFVTGLLHSFNEEGIPAASIWAAAPIYLRAVNPAVALQLLEVAEQVTGTSLDLGDLRRRSSNFIREVDEMLAKNPELANQLKDIIELGPTQDDPQATQSASSADLPNAASLVEELERFLREQRTEGDEG
jgi:proteasome assembly chaperone (PAC2) family protein